MKLGLGTAALGRPQYINVRTESCDNSNLAEFRKHSFSVLEEAYNLGIRYFDTAPGYGLAEELVLEWLKTKNDKTIEIISTTKKIFLGLMFHPERKNINQKIVNKIIYRWLK